MDERSREFHPAGQVLREAVYEDGHEVGLVRGFHANGQLRRGAFHIHPGGERAVVEFTESGQLAALRCADRPLLAPVVDDARLCGFDGVPSQVELHDARGGLRTERRFSPDGVKRYELVSLVGARAFKQRELEYSDRGTLVRERAWNDDGTPGRDDEVFEDGSRKVFAK
ncbi:MAG: hypothetical protein EOP70_16260 [Variovorax sp.]|nr:MAG: hypothetical protein EOP70_16260 [Variovorax sp.]